MNTSEPLIFGSVVIERPSCETQHANYIGKCPYCHTLVQAATPAEFQELLRGVRLLSDGGKRSITIPNGDVPTLIAALELAADRAT